MKLDTLQQLFVEELRDLYSAETQLTKALPKLATGASSPKLRQAFEKHLKQTEQQVARLEQIFQHLGESPRGRTCKGMEGLLKEGEEMLKQKAEPAVHDAALISAAQRVEHYEIAGYGTVCSYARRLRNSDAERLLQETLDEEGATDKLLTQLAESEIHVEAV